MTTMVDLLLFAGSFFILMIIVKAWCTKRKPGYIQPPAFPSIPLLGSLPFVRDFDALPLFFQKKAVELGPIFTLRFGNRRVVVLNNQESIEDALVRHGSSFSGRESFYTEKYVCNRNQKGIGSANYNAEFKKYRKLSLSILRDFGFRSKSLMESRILLQIADLINQFKKIDGKPFDPHDLIIKAISNLFHNITFGRTRNYETGMDEILVQMMRWTKSVNPALDLFPFIRFFPPHNRKLRDVSDSSARILELLEKEVQRSLKDGIEDCFVSKYIGKEGNLYDHEQLMFTLRDFALGSTETVTTTLSWAFIFLANNPDVAERIQMEIDSVIPRNRLPATDDERKLPYTQATILEIFRHRPALPLAVPHLTLHDTEVLGYFIPANTIVIPNLRAAHMTEKDWEEPDAFKPERFLNEKNEVINNDRVIAFSLGRRSCPGEQLARQQLYLFVTGLLQNFFIRPPDGVQLIDSRSVFGAVEAPSRYELIMIRRN